MKKLIFAGLLMAYLPLPANAQKFDPARPVRRAKPAVASDFVLSPDALRKTIEHMQRLAKEGEEKIDAQAAQIETLEAALSEQDATLAKGQAHAARVQQISKELASSVADLEKARQAEAVKKWKAYLFGAPMILGIGIVLGILIALFSRVGVKLAGLAARVGLKASTGL